MSESRSDVRFVFPKLATGTTLRCAEAGPRDGLPVLFLHGYSDHWRSFAPILPHLPPAFRAIVPDQRGHGRSERPAAGYDVETLAADAAALLDELGVARAAVVGHSMGSLVAQRLAAEHPERVERLVLVGSGATLADNPAVHELVAQVRALADPVPRAFVEAFQAATMVRPVPAELVEALVDEGCAMPARVWRALADGLERFDGRADLARITAPTRLVWGDGDGFFLRADQHALLSRLPHAELAIYTGTGHAPQWEEPERFARELAAFLLGS